MRRSPHHLAVAVLTTVTALVALAGCSEAEDAARGAVNDAACQVARTAVDQAAQQAGQAIDDIGADPQAAQLELRAVRDTLATAEKGVDGDVKAKVAQARTSVEDLLGQAEDAARGAEIDTSAVDKARSNLDSAVEDVKNLC